MQIENCVNRTLNVIFDITKTIAYMKGIASLVPDSKFVCLNKQANHFPLLPSEYISKYIDLEHWWIQGVLPACALPMGSNSFVFTDIFTKKCLCQSWHPPNGLGPPPMGNPESTTVEDDSNTQFCSHRSEIWHKLRSKARITGSSMFRALGFNTLKEEKEHFYV